MKQASHFYSQLIVLLLASVLVGTGCNRLEVTPPTPTPPLQVDLTAANIVVERLREGTNPYTLQKDEVISDLQMNDRISVKEHGRGLLRFSDSLLIELFRDTDALVPEVHLDPGGFIFVRLKQVFGHSRTRLESIAQGRVTVETDYATITALVNGTEFAVCHGPDVVTCMVAVSGEVEVEAQGQVVNVKGGEATYILPGEPPKPAICANMDEVRQWLDKKRGPEQVDPLGALVIGWPQEPCHEDVSQLPPSPEAAASPISAPPTQEPIPSPTALPTSELEPTVPPTAPPTAEPEPIAPTPAPMSSQALCTVLVHKLNLRYGPGFGYRPPVTTLFTGMLLDPLARNFDGRWIQVRVRESGQLGWVAAKPAYISCNMAVADLPVSQ